MNEILTYAAMIKVDSSKKSQYVKLIDAISDDIDACEAIISSNGEARPALGIIDCPEYLSRLSPSERSDEDEFDSYKVVPDSGADEADIIDKIKDLINRAASEISSGSSDDSECRELRARLEDSEKNVARLQDSVDAMDSLKDELKSCRSRLEEVTKALDDSQGRVG